jgi:serine/threonine protein phosphatase PrpC
VPATCFAATRPADGHSANEDAFLVRGASDRSLLALADGAGAAEQAARRVIRRLEGLAGPAEAESLRCFPTWAGWMRLLDAELRGRAESTLVAAAVLEGRIVGSCVGDSRAYLWNREGDLRILTDGADKRRLGSGRIAPFPLHVPFAHGELLLLLSDGAWTQLSLPRLRTIISGFALGRTAELPDAILREASRTGRADDMTVVVAGWR